MMNASPLLKKIAQALCECRLEVVLIRNAATALQGVPVTTLDVDFMFRKTSINLKKIKNGGKVILFNPITKLLAGVIAGKVDTNILSSCICAAPIAVMFPAVGNVAPAVVSLSYFQLRPKVKGDAPDVKFNTFAVCATAAILLKLKQKLYPFSALLKLLPLYPPLVVNPLS